jgi:hypothetical protein
MTGDGVTGDGMTGEESLARGYGWLLRWYPADHRARHGEEMLGVLMAGAPDGSRRPGPGESANLIAGALRIRLRAATAGSAPLWREALTRAAVVLPLALLGSRLLATGLALHQADVRLTSIFRLANFPEYYGDLIAPVLILLAAVLLTGRRAALVVTAALAVLQFGYMGTHGPSEWVAPGSAMLLAILGVVALALAAAPGRWRGRSVLRWWQYPLALAAGALPGAASALARLAVHPSAQASGLTYELADAAAVTLIAVTMLAVSPASRRLLAAVALPAYYYTVLRVMPTYGPLRITLTLVPVVALVAVAAVLTRRRAMKEVS